MATTEVSLNSIQEQIEVCDDITDLIDKIVPHMYKVRNQIKAQKNYINDVQRVLIGSGTSSIGTINSIPKVGSLVNDTPLTGITDKITTLSSSNTAAQRGLFQSIFKYKHDYGVLETNSGHFTSEQIGSSNDRTSGLNLDDVQNIMTGLDTLFTIDNKPTTYDSTSNDVYDINSTNPSNVHLKHILLKPLNINFDTVTPAAGNSDSIIAGVGATAYTAATNGGITSLLTDSDITHSVIGFGL